MILYANTTLSKDYYHFILINSYLKEILHIDYEGSICYSYLKEIEQFHKEESSLITDDYLISYNKKYNFLLKLETKEEKDTKYKK